MVGRRTSLNRNFQTTLLAMENTVKKLPKNRFHLVFSLLMGAMMISLKTFVITFVNVGLVEDFVGR